MPYKLCIIHRHEGMANYTMARVFTQPEPKAANFRKRLIDWRILEPEVRRVQHEGPVRAVRDRCDCFGEGPQVPVKQTFIPATPSVTKSRKQRAEIHRGSRRRWIWPPNKAGYTPAIVIADPDPNRLLQQRQ